jgi:hypothetical protein
MPNIHAMTPTQLKRHLERENKKLQRPPEVLKVTLNEWIAEKKKVRSEKAKRITIKRYWRELLEPLRLEIKNVRAMLYYESSDTLRREALELYFACLKYTLRKLVDDVKAKHYTPFQLARVRYIPNNGTHWADWVKPVARMDVLDAFAQLPRAGVKTKVPFERTLPKKLGLKMQTRLRVRTEKELESLEVRIRDALVGRDEEKAARLRLRVPKVKEALVRIAQLGPTEPAPTTWHGLFGLTEEE